MDNEYQENNLPSTPEELLRSVARKYRELVKEADYEIEVNRDASAYREKIRQGAELFTSLHGQLMELIKHGHEFPDSSLMDIEALSMRAKDALRRDTPLEYSLIFTPPDSKIDGPNYLEVMIDELYPSQASDTAPDTVDRLPE